MPASIPPIPTPQMPPAPIRTAPIPPAPSRLEKTARPHAHFEAPMDIVDDDALSKAQKVNALGSLEQDARQLADAASEGMAGGEPTGLRDVLAAQASLALPPIEHAYARVERDLAARLAAAPPGIAYTTIAHAQAALTALALLSLPETASTEAQNAAEAAEEAARERLDP